jgi:HAD superfamily hydrolase (TIGR01509 family)
MTGHLDRVQGLVVDWDGTCADNQEGRLQSLIHALGPYDATITADWYAQHAGLPIRTALALLPAPRPLPIEDVVRASRTYMLNGPPPRPIPTTLDLLTQAQELGIPCAVASSADRVLVETGIRHLGLTTAFAAVVTAECVTHGKPAPDCYLEAARCLGLPPGACLAVDDAAEGIAAARAAGMHVLTIQDGALVAAPAVAA